MRGSVVVVLGLIVIAIALAANSFFTVNEMQEAVVFQLGEPKAVINAPGGKDQAGLYTKIPGVQRVIYFDKRIQSADMDSLEVPDSERRRILVDAFVRYRIVEPLKFYQTLVNESNARQRMLALLSSALRNEFGTTTIFTVLSEERDDVMRAIRKSVNQQASEFGIKVVDVRIRRADLPQQNINSIVDRMVAERKREANEARAEGQEIKNTIESQADRERTVILAEAQKQSDIIRGQGDAERNQIYAKAYSKDPKFFAFYRSMQAYKGALSDKDTTMVISPTGEFFKYLRDDSGK